MPTGFPASCFPFSPNVDSIHVSPIPTGQRGQGISFKKVLQMQTGRSMPKGSSRNLGNNYCLAWNTGGGTHMTLVYMENVRRGYEQDRARRLVEEFLEETGVPEQLELTLGEMMTNRCISVTSATIRGLQEAIYDFLAEHGFQLRSLRDPHIDLRGQSDAILVDAVLTRKRNW